MLGLRLLFDSLASLGRTDQIGPKLEKAVALTRFLYNHLIKSFPARRLDSLELFGPEHAGVSCFLILVVSQSHLATLLLEVPVGGLSSQNLLLNTCSSAFLLVGNGSFVVLSRIKTLVISCLSILELVEGARTFALDHLVQSLPDKRFPCGCERRLLELASMLLHWHFGFALGHSQRRGARLHRDNCLIHLLVRWR